MGGKDTQTLTKKTTEEAIRVGVAVEIVKAEVSNATRLVAATADRLTDQSDEVLRGYSDLLVEMVDRIRTYAFTCCATVAEVDPKMKAEPLPDIREMLEQMVALTTMNLQAEDVRREKGT